MENPLLYVTSSAHDGTQHSVHAASVCIIATGQWEGRLLFLKRRVLRLFLLSSVLSCHLKVDYYCFQGVRFDIVHLISTSGMIYILLYAVDTLLVEMYELWSLGIEICKIVRIKYSYLRISKCYINSWPSWYEYFTRKLL